MTRIVYRYLDMNAIALFTLATLRERSPVGSSGDKHPGLYRDSHMLFINGHSVSDATSWQSGMALEFANPEPYARKIELGTIKVTVPNHVYEDTAAIVRAQYGDVVNVQFTFMPVRFGSTQAYAQSAAARASHSNRALSKARRDWLARQPAIVITER